MNKNDNHLVFTRVGENKDIMIGGYILPNTFGSTTYNMQDTVKENMEGGNIGTISSLFKGLAVPAGLFLMQQSVSDKPVTDTMDVIERQVIDGKLYDKLLNMVSPSDKKKYIKNTRKNRITKNKNTRKIR